MQNKCSYIKVRSHQGGLAHFSWGGDSKSTRNGSMSQWGCHSFVVIKSDFWPDFFRENHWEEVGLYNQYYCMISTHFMNAVIIVLCNDFVCGFLGRNGTSQSNVVLIV